MHILKPVRHATEIRALATLLSAGLSAQQAIESLACSTEGDQPQRELQSIASQVRQGKPFSFALQSQRWCTPGQSALLALAEHGGRLPEALAQLASDKELSLQRARYLRSRITGTLCLTLLAALIAAWLADKKGSLSFWHYFLGTLPSLISLVMAAGMLVWLVTRDRLFWARLSWLAPTSVAGASRAFEIYWSDALRLSLEAGIDIAQAVTQLKSLMDFPHYRANMQELSNRLKRGSTLCQAASSWPLSPPLRAALTAGESSGTLPASLRHFVLQETRHLNLMQQTLDDWLPRGFYLWAITLSMGFF